MLLVTVVREEEILGGQPMVRDENLERENLRKKRTSKERDLHKPSSARLRSAIRPWLLISEREGRYQKGPSSKPAAIAPKD